MPHESAHGCIDAVACLSRHPGDKLVSLTQSKTLLHSDRVSAVRVSTATVRDSLVLELKLAVSQGTGETTLGRLEAFLTPMYAALPKTSMGFLEMLL